VSPFGPFSVTETLVLDVGVTDTELDDDENVTLVPPETVAVTVFPDVVVTSTLI
jgi:hypothetical protein